MQSIDNFLIVLDFIVIERPAFTVFEPFLCGLVAADVKSPCF
jgi:hypothetical protein